MDKKPIELPQNAIVGTWKVLTPLGQGGQGGVWAVKAVGVKHAPHRALKACFAADEQPRARFVRELDMLQQCDSPNILKVYDQDRGWKDHVPGVPPFAYYVSEKCAGSMADRSGHLGDARRRLDLFKQACAAVGYLHSRSDRVIHRDIKPQNLLIGQELSNVLLADFGIARAASDSPLTQAFEVVGTPYYRAPEVLHGSHGTVESDVYGLGRLLEWLLTGEVSTDLATRPVPRGAELHDDACYLLDGIISKATQAVPSHRYNSVAALVEHVPDLWLSVRPRSQPAPALSDTDAATVLPAALQLARANDQVGWRQLQNQLRRDLVTQCLQWRGERETRWRRDDDKAQGVAFTDSLLDAAMGRMMLALAGVFSNVSVFADQRPLVEDILAIPGWSRGGTTAIVESPRTLVYIFQYLHGALCMTYERPDLALQLGRMPIEERSRSGSQPLWKDHASTGWPSLLGGRCTWAWEYLCGLYESRPVLQQLFALPSDYEAGLASYSALMVLYELADDASLATPEALMKPETFVLDFPPLFVALPRTAVATAVRRTLGNREVVSSMSAHAGTSIDAMMKLWPARRGKIFKFCRDVFDRWSHPEDIPIPERLG